MNGKFTASASSADLQGFLAASSPGKSVIALPSVAVRAAPNRFDVRILNTHKNLHEIGVIWRQLSAESPRSYFLSWAWTEAWLSALPPRSNVKLVVLSDACGPAVAFFLGNAHISRYGLLRSNAFFLNETGDPAIDQLCIEQNGPLARHDVTVDALDILDALPDGWEELYLSGLPAESALLQTPVPYSLRVKHRSKSHFVELRRIHNINDYVNLLSPSTRYQIRRAHKLYEENFGSVEVQLAASCDQALRFFDELVELHQQRWVGKGASGAFHNRFFHAFHRNLIHKRLDSGEIQILRIRAGRTTIGCLYNFVFNGTVSFYQSGFRYDSDNKLKPGLLAHAQAILFNAKQGYRIYDLMSGVARYKQSLCTNSRELVWAVFAKPKIKFMLEQKLRQWKRALASFCNFAP
jgi:CelD/BcsL family acetyltransferase involved in cellulose biosynthesis